MRSESWATSIWFLVWTSLTAASTRKRCWLTFIIRSILTDEQSWPLFCRTITTSSGTHLTFLVKRYFRTGPTRLCHSTRKSTRFSRNSNRWVFALRASPKRDICAKVTSVKAFTGSSTSSSSFQRLNFSWVPFLMLNNKSWRLPRRNVWQSFSLVLKSHSDFPFSKSICIPMIKKKYFAG